MPLNNQINRTEYQRQLARAFVLREGSPAPQLAPDIQPVVMVEDLSKPGPHSRETIRRCSTFTPVAAVAAQLSGVQLFNPVGSGILACLDWVVVSKRTAGAQPFIANLENSQVGVAGSALLRQFWDTRLAGRPRAEQSAYNNAASQVTGASGIFMVPSADRVALDTTGIILSEGWGLVLESANLNVDFDVMWVWREFTNPEP